MRNTPQPPHSTARCRRLALHIHLPPGKHSRDLSEISSEIKLWWDVVCTYRHCDAALSTAASTACSKQSASALCHSDTETGDHVQMSLKGESWNHKQPLRNLPGGQVVVWGLRVYLRSSQGMR